MSLPVHFMHISLLSLFHCFLSKSLTLATISWPFSHTHHHPSAERCSSKETFMGHKTNKIVQENQRGRMLWELGVGGRFQMEGTYVHLWLIHVDIRQKPTQYCIAIILQFKKSRRLLLCLPASYFLSPSLSPSLSLFPLPFLSPSGTVANHGSSAAPRK